MSKSTDLTEIKYVEVGTIKKIKLEPGDRVFLEYSGRLSEASHERISRLFKAAGLGEVIFLEEGMKIGVVNCKLDERGKKS